MAETPRTFRCFCTRIMIRVAKVTFFFDISKNNCTFAE